MHPARLTAGNKVVNMRRAERSLLSMHSPTSTLMSEEPSTPIVVRFTCGEEKRRLCTNLGALKWSFVAGCIADFQWGKRFTVTYLDDESECITVSSTNELRDAALIAIETKPAGATRATLRLTVSASSPPDGQAAGASTTIHAAAAAAVDPGVSAAVADKAPAQVADESSVSIDQGCIVSFTNRSTGAKMIGSVTRLMIEPLVHPAGRADSVVISCCDDCDSNYQESSFTEHTIRKKDVVVITHTNAVESFEAVAQLANLDKSATSGTGQRESVLRAAYHLLCSSHIQGKRLEPRRFWAITDILEGALLGLSGKKRSRAEVDYTEGDRVLRILRIETRDTEAKGGLPMVEKIVALVEPATGGRRQEQSFFEGGGEHDFACMSGANEALEAYNRKHRLKLIYSDFGPRKPECES